MTGATAFNGVRRPQVTMRVRCLPAVEFWKAELWNTDPIGLAELAPPRAYGYANSR